MAPGLTAWAKAKEDLPPGVDLDAEPKLPFLSPDQIDAEGRRSGSPGAVKISKTSRSGNYRHHRRHRGKKATYDLHRQMEDATKVKTSEFATAIIENMA